MNSDNSDSPAAPSFRRQDNLPRWVVALLVIFLVMRVYDVCIYPLLTHSSHKSQAAAKAGGLDDEAMQDWIQTDLQAKYAFVLAHSKPATVVHPDGKSLQDALKAAERLQKETGNSPGAARRVILLRALVDIAMPGDKNVPPLAIGKNKLAPLDAFGAALPADLDAADKARYAGEARLWRTVFEGGKLTSSQIGEAAAKISRLPNIRWWRSPALMALYNQQNDSAKSNSYAMQARADAVPSLVPFGLLGALRIGLILLGIALLLYFAYRARQRRKLPPGAALKSDLWPTVPERIPLSERRLGAGDLMGVFVLYLVTRAVIEFLLTGASGFDVKGLPHFAGLLAPFHGTLQKMPSSDRMTAEIVLESIVYLLSAVPPFIMLWTLARQRGANLGDELGWTSRNLGANLLYGIGGFGIASALILPVSAIARQIFQYAPDPSNPVIPQLANTSGFWGPFLLIALASIGAPIIEELLFRGVFYNSAKMLIGVWPAIVLTGLVFGFIHPVGIAEMFAIATLGGVFAWMAETRKSLAPSMLGHFLLNSTSTLLLLSVLSG